jgi:hypothetical protein
MFGRTTTPTPERATLVDSGNSGWGRLIHNESHTKPALQGIEGLRPGFLVSSTPRYPSLPCTYTVDERWE